MTSSRAVSKQGDSPFFPLIILADEPTANLDHNTGEEILSLMKKINQDQKTTFIFSTHDQKVIDKSSRAIKLWDGKIII